MDNWISDEAILEIKERLASINDKCESIGAATLAAEIVIEKQAQQIADLQAEIKKLLGSIDIAYNALAEFGAMEVAMKTLAGATIKHDSKPEQKDWHAAIDEFYGMGGEDI